MAKHFLCIFKGTKHFYRELLAKYFPCILIERDQNFLPLISSKMATFEMHAVFRHFFGMLLSQA